MKIIILYILFSSIIFGQSILYKKGVSGISLGYAYTTNDYSTGNGVGLILSAGGVFDLGVSYSSFSSPDSHLEGNSFVPNISYVIRNENKLGGISLSLGYISSKIRERETIYVSNEYIKETKISGLVVGGSAAVQIYNDDALTLLPSIGLNYAFSSSNDSENPNSITSRNASIQMIIRYIKNEFGIYFSPDLLINLDAGRDGFSYGLTLGVSFNLKDNTINN
jgi:hypothetical protein